MKRSLAICFFLFNSAVIADITGLASVIDGDTIDINGVRIRLNGIDSPEKEQICRKEGMIWYCGVEAAKAMRHLTNGHIVSCIGNTKDRYRRLIAECFVGTINLNASMVKIGLALAYRQYSSEYLVEEIIAKKTKKGLWSGEFVAPWDWRQGKRLSKKSN